MRSYRYRYAVYGFLIAASYCALLFVLHYLVSDGTPSQLLREVPAAAILVFLSLPVCLLTGYLLGAERDRRKSDRLLTEKHREQADSIGELSAQLAQQDEMRDMAVIAIREMRHPLTSIVGYTMTLRGYWDRLDDDSKRDFIEYIKISSSKLEAMSNDLLRIMEPTMRLSRTQVVNMDLQEMVSEVVGILEEVYAERGLKIALRFLGDIPEMQSDPSLFFDLIFNLLDVCLRCSEDNGMVSAWCGCKAPKITLHLRCHHSTLRARELTNIRQWPPPEGKEELATLAMEYRLANNMVREISGEFKMESVGDRGLSFLVSFPQEPVLTGE